MPLTALDASPRHTTFSPIPQPGKCHKSCKIRFITHSNIKPPNPQLTNCKVGNFQIHFEISINNSSASKGILFKKLRSNDKPAIVLLNELNDVFLRHVWRYERKSEPAASFSLRCFPGFHTSNIAESAISFGSDVPWPESGHICRSISLINRYACTFLRSKYLSFRESAGNPLNPAKINFFVNPFFPACGYEVTEHSPPRSHSAMNEGIEDAHNRPRERQRYSTFRLLCRWTGS